MERTVTISLKEYEGLKKQDEALRERKTIAMCWQGYWYTLYLNKDETYKAFLEKIEQLIKENEDLKKKTIK